LIKGNKPRIKVTEWSFMVCRNSLVCDIEVVVEIEIKGFWLKLRFVGSYELAMM
jgi:hypothetical protein